MSEKPEVKVSIYIDARDAPQIPCKLHFLGFQIEAYASDLIKLKPKGFKDFPEGAWVTAEDLHQFIDGLTEILEKVDELPMSRTHDVLVDWKEVVTE